MELRDFREFVKKLVLYHQPNKTPKGESIDLWYEDVKHIPASALPGIYDVLKGSEYPYNLARAILAVHNGNQRTAGNGLWQPGPADYRERDRFDEAKKRFEALTEEDQRKRMIQVAKEFNVVRHMSVLDGLIRCQAIWNMARSANLEVVR